MDKQKTRRAAPRLLGRAAAWAAQLWNEEHLHTLVRGVQRFIICAVLARGTVFGGYAPFGLAMAAALMADDDLTKEDIKELRDFFNSRF